MGRRTLLGWNCLIRTSYRHELVALALVLAAATSCRSSSLVSPTSSSPQGLRISAELARCSWDGGAGDLSLSVRLISSSVDGEVPVVSSLMLSAVGDGGATLKGHGGWQSKDNVHFNLELNSLRTKPSEVVLRGLGLEFAGTSTLIAPSAEGLIGKEFPVPGGNGSVLAVRDLGDSLQVALLATNPNPVLQIEAPLAASLESEGNQGVESLPPAGVSRGADWASVLEFPVAGRGSALESVRIVLSGWQARYLGPSLSIDIREAC